MTTNKVLVSACLLGEPVRYDGRDNRFDHPLLNKLRREKRLVSICPEVAGGLSTPRPYASIENRFPIHIITSDREDVTAEFLAGAEAAAELAKQQGCVAALMKANSPSCGNNQVLGGSFSGKLVPGAGVAAQELIHAGIPVFNEEQLPELEALLNRLDAELHLEIA